jgi:hypothetical protein
VPTSIIYNSLGTNPSYYKDPLSLYEGNQEGTGNNILVPDCYWEIEGVRDNYISFKNSTRNGRAQLVPCNIYITDFNQYPVLKCIDNDSNVLWY